MISYFIYITTRLDYYIYIIYYYIKSYYLKYTQYIHVCIHIQFICFHVLCQCFFLLVGSQDAHEKWEECRTANCDTRGGHKREKKEQVNLATFRREEEYADFFDEGTITPLAEFLVSKGIDPDKIGNDVKQRRFVEEEPQLRHQPIA